MKYELKSDEDVAEFLNSYGYSALSSSLLEIADTMRKNVIDTVYAVPESRWYKRSGAGENFMDSIRISSSKRNGYVFFDPDAMVARQMTPPLLNQHMGFTDQDTGEAFDFREYMAKYLNAEHHFIEKTEEDIQGIIDDSFTGASKKSRTYAWAELNETGSYNVTLSGIRVKKVQ